MAEIAKRSAGSEEVTKSQTESRRAFLKRAGINTAKKGLAVIGAGYTFNAGWNSVMNEDPELPFQQLYDYLRAPERDSEMKDIEDELDIRLITLSDAYRKLGIQIVNRPELLGDVVPWRWTKERAELLPELFSHLPSQFHDRSSNGEQLQIALTNFGERRIAGRYHSLLLTEDVMLLDFDIFSPNNKARALKLLCHESIHRLQSSPTFESRTEEVIGRPFESFCRDVAEKMESEGVIFYPKLTSFKKRLPYAIKDTLGDKSPRKDPTEFEARISEFYLYGHEYFMRYCGRYFGEEEASNIYDYLRDDFFGGLEYEQFPFDVEISSSSAPEKTSYISP